MFANLAELAVNGRSMIPTMDENTLGEILSQTSSRKNSMSSLKTGDIVDLTSEETALPDSSNRGIDDTDDHAQDEMSTPTSQKLNPSVKRWASVVKCQKKIVYTPDSSPKLKTLDSSKVLDDSSFPKDYIIHKGFTEISSCKTYISCKICCLGFKSIQSLTNHLKTRKHEDSIIQFFKDKIPPHLHYMMEFVSFFGANLCCNLCKTEVNMSSQNPHETVLNIISHNTDLGHSSLKQNNSFQYTHADNIVLTLAEQYKQIKTNIQFIDNKMIPQFECSLCKKHILFTKDLEKLANNFTNHFSSNSHIKNTKAIQILNKFSGCRSNEKDQFVFQEGTIFCTYCKIEIEADIETLQSHENEFEHAKNKFIGQDLPAYAEMAKKSKFENLINEEKAACQIQSSNAHCSVNQIGIDCQKLIKKESGDQIKREQSDSNMLSSLFKTLKVPASLKNLNNFMMTEKNSITCLICDCTIPPNPYNIQTHLLGNNHKKKLDVKDIRTTVKDNDKSPKEGNTGNMTEIFQSSTEKGTKHLLVPKCSESSTMVKIEGNPNATHLNSNHQTAGKCSDHGNVNFPELEQIPEALRADKCRKQKVLPLKVIKKKFDVIVKRNTLVASNKDWFENDVDGINSYCKLCKVLIPLTLKVDELEKTFESHIVKKQHSDRLPKNIEKDSNTSLGVSGRMMVNSKCKKSPHTNNRTFRVQTAATVFTAVSPSPKKTNTQLEKEASFKENEVFFFGKENIPSQKEKNNEDSVTLAKKPILPVKKLTRTFKIESETDEDTLKRREKQIVYGKSTDGYRQYLEKVPLLKRQPKHPFTPPKYMKCSRRTWDGLVKVWRRQLHSWDPDSATTGSTLEFDIQPLS